MCSTFKDPLLFPIRRGSLLLVAFLCTSCPPSRGPGPASENGARDLEMPAPDAVSALYSDDADPDGGGADAGEADLFAALRLGRKVPLETGPMSEFFEALEALSADPDAHRLVRVLHYGDSHTAADVLTTAIRRAFQTRFGDGGRGFVYLGKPWRSYRPIDMETDARGGWIPRRIFAGKDPSRMDGRYGLGGVAVDAPPKGASTTVGTSRGSDFCNKASGFEIFYLKQPGGGTFEVRIDGRQTTVVDTASEELTSGFFQKTLKEGRHSMEIRTEKDQQVRLFGAVVERRGPGVVYDTLGINGAFFHTSLQWEETLMAEQIAHRSPDLIIAMYGANDVDIRRFDADTYEDQIRRVMSRFLSAAPNASCLLLGPTDRKGPKSGEDDGARLDLIIDVQRRTAEALDCAFMDLREVMGGSGARTRWQENGLAQKDGVHLTIPGYRILGELVAERLMEAHDRYREEKINEQGAPNSDSRARE